MKNIIVIFSLFVILVIDAQSESCPCGQGYGSKRGDKPEVVYTFNDSNAISFCGYLHDTVYTNEFRMSEFNVFTCTDTGFLGLIGYSAIHSCKVKLGRDTVRIHRLTSLPTGKNNEFVLYPFSSRIITSKDSKMNVSVEKVILQIPAQHYYAALPFLKLNYNQMDYNALSVYIGKITILAMFKDQRALDILYSKELEDYCSAATAEHLSESRAMLNWALYGKMDWMFWR